MLFNERSLKSLRALRGQSEARLRPELAKIAEALNLGRQLGKHRVVSREDIETLVTHARRETGWDFEAELEGQGRLETATDNEKLGGRAAYHGMVMIRQWGDVYVGAQIVPVEALENQDFDSVLVIENAAVMFHFSRLRVAWPSEVTKPLVIYRGDKQFSPKWVAQWLKSIDKPVDAVPDLDPAGLVIAAKYPRLRHLILPDVKELPIRKRINHQRFLKQVAKSGRECPKPCHAQVHKWWNYIMAMESAIPQEAWLSKSP